MGERLFEGLPASPGLAAGAAVVLDPPPADTADAVPPARREEEARRAAEALEGAAAQLESLAASLVAGGRPEEAEIVETGALMARDPGLAAEAMRLVAEGFPAAAAVVAAAELHAAALAAIPDEMLAARADDVRSIGRRAARLAAGEAPAAPAGQGVIVATDLGPADVAEIHGSAIAIALAAGGPTAHAAIVARSLGLPMVTGLGPAVLRVAAGETLVVDGDAGTVVASAEPARSGAARDATAQRVRARARAAAARGLPAVTRDGERIAVLANVAGAPEVHVALEAGADGVGLVRTELAFLDARSWPGDGEHVRALSPVLAPLRGMPVTVRVLDYGGDKLPPFLEGELERGVGLLLRHPEAFEAQLRAILIAGAETDLRIMLPLVDGAAQMVAAHKLLERARAATRSRKGVLGAMVETPRAAAAARSLAHCSAFLSIGTNDLTASTLGVDRFAAGPAVAHDPRVLAHIARTARAARAAGIPLEVCGEAASDPVTAPILIGLGVRELSVGAARVGTVRSWVRALSAGEARELSERALAAPDAAAVAELAEPLAARLRSVERDDAAPEGLESDGGVIAVGPQP